MNLEQWDAAVQALRTGISKGGLDRPDQAQVMLGQSFFNMNAFDEAREAFKPPTCRPVAQLHRQRREPTGAAQRGARVAVTQPPAQPTGLNADDRIGVDVERIGSPKHSARPWGD
jgi:hypothetical protein